MDESLIDKNYIKPGMDVATGYAKENFKDLKPVPPMAWLNDPGAGGIYASVHDLAKWMNVQLAGGALPQNGRRRQAEADVLRGQPAPDVDHAHADHGGQAADARAGAGDAELLRLRRKLVPVRLPRPPAGLAYRRLAGLRLAPDPGAGTAPGRGGADQCASPARRSTR